MRPSRNCTKSLRGVPSLSHCAKNTCRKGLHSTRACVHTRALPCAQQCVAHTQFLFTGTYTVQRSWEKVRHTRSALLQRATKDSIPNAASPRSSLGQKLAHLGGKEQEKVRYERDRWSEGLGSFRTTTLHKAFFQTFRHHSPRGADIGGTSRE